MKAADKRWLLLLLCLYFLLIQTGCWDQKIYERIGFILQMGLELDEKDNLLYTVSVPIVAPEIEGTVEILSTSTSLLREAREQVRRVSGRAVEGGKIQHLYFSKELAEKGITPFMEIFLRNPENPLLANVIIVDGSPKEMMELSAEFKDKPRPAFYVNELLVNARQNSYIPETRIYDFITMDYSKTIDPIAPLFRYNEKEIETAGTALFQRDRLVGEIDAATTGLLHLLMGIDQTVHYMYHELDMQQSATDIKKGAALMIKGNHRKIDIDLTGNIPVVAIKLNLKASLAEFERPNNLDDPEAKRRFEEQVAQAISRDCQSLLEYLQGVGSDPLGIGEALRSRHNSYWKSVSWREVYPDIKFQTDVKLVFEFYGAIN